MNLVVHVACIYYVGRAYYYFRKTGGIKGLNPTKDLPEDKALRVGTKAVNLAVDQAHKKMDEGDMEKDDGFLAIKEAQN